MEVWQKDIIGSLIGLTGQYILPPINRDDKNIGIVESFLPKNFSGIGLTWAITKKGEKLINKIIKLLRLNIDYLVNSRRKILVNYLQDFYKEIYRKKDIFDVDKMLFSLKNPGTTLLDCSLFINKQDLGIWLYNNLIEYLAEHIIKQIIFIPLYRIKIESDCYSNNIFNIFKRNDKSVLKYYENRYVTLSYFDPNRCTVDEKPCMFIDQEQLTAWFCMEYIGDIESNLNHINKIVRIIFSFLFAEASKTNKNYKMNTYIITFNNSLLIFDENKKVKEIGANNLQHNFAGEINLSDLNLKRIFQAIELVKKQNYEDYLKFSLFCEYFMKSLNTIDEERIINLFIGIDALWGIEGKNKLTICNGIKSVLIKDKNRDEKAKMLYDLRCELLHGGCYMIDSWSKYDTYINKFNTEPMDDLLNIYISKFEEYLL